MIISHKHKFIFIKTNRTAGTSVQIGLEKSCGPEDVVCVMGPHTPEELGTFTPRNEGGYRGHDRACMVMEKIGTEIWNDYYIAAFTRNPWDRMVSNFMSRRVPKKGHSPEHFQEWAFSMSNVQVGNWGYYTDSLGEKIIVDFVGKYENLEQDYIKICVGIGIEAIELPHLKGGGRPKGDDYRRYYNKQMIEFVRNHPTSRKEIECFGYEF